MDGGRSIRQLTDDELVAKRTEAINMCKGETWYKLFLIAKAMDKKLVSPPEPDPSDCSITKREWNKVLFKWEPVKKETETTLFRTEATQQKEHATHNLYIFIRCHFGQLLVFASCIGVRTLHVTIAARCLVGFV